MFDPSLIPTGISFTCFCSEMSGQMSLKPEETLLLKDTSAGTIIIGTGPTPCR